MTIPATPFRKDHTGNGTTGPYLYDWKIESNTHLRIIRTVIATGIETLLVLGVDYSVTGVGNPSGGNVNLAASLPNTEKITILPNVPYEQDTDFTNQNSVKPQSAEDMADKLSRQIKQIAEKLGRAVTLPESDTGSPINYITQMNQIYQNTVVAQTAAETARDDILNNLGFIIVSADLLGANTIGTVAGSIAHVITVSGSIGNVNTVAASIASVNTVAGNMTNVNTVATNIAAVNTAATNIAAIIAAPTEAANAAASASQALTYRNQAQAYADSMAFRDVVFITSANSPYTITQANHNGKLISVDTSGGAVTINLPQISGLVIPFVFAVKKATGDSNAVTINRAGTDTINDGTSTNKIISSVGGSQFLPDLDTTPDRWTTLDFGASSAEEKRQVFSAGTDFTAGSTTTLTLTNAPIAGTSAGLDIAFDGLQQFSTEWSYNPTTGVITFTSAIPLNTLKVECRWRTSLPVGITSDGSVTWAKLASGIIASVAQMLSGAANTIVSADNFKTFVDTYLIRKEYGASQATTSGTSKTWAVPAGCNKFTVMFDNVTTNGSGHIGVRLGTASTPQTTGYLGTSIEAGGVNGVFAPTDQAGVIKASAGRVLNGAYTFTRMTGNKWTGSHSLGFSSASNVGAFGGFTVNLSGAINIVEVRSGNGSDTFTAGSINILFEV